MVQKFNIQWYKHVMQKITRMENIADIPI